MSDWRASPGNAMTCVATWPMLILPDVFERTWSIRADLFWPKATESVRRKHPHFLCMAEVYWDLEWTMQQQGFNDAYDKRLYDRLREGQARPVREHFHAGLDYQIMRDGQWQLLACVPVWEGTGRGIASWLLPGKARMETGCYREGDDLQARGFYLDEPPWKASIFALTKRDEETEVPR